MKTNLTNPFIPLLDIHLGLGKCIGPAHPAFFIAEIGQNHQGDFTLACELIKRSKLAGVDCVKFQRGHLEHKFTPEALHRSYDNDRSWATLYGEHKRVLDFTTQEFKRLKDYADSQDILMSSSAMDVDAAKFLLQMQLPFIKIGSGDINNGELLDYIGKQSNVNLILSTGMCNMSDVINVYDRMKSFQRPNFALLHCTSAYPTPIHAINLNVITTYKNRFPDINVGYSGHEQGFVSTLGAIALGAKIIERHVTLDKTMKGADHSCSLNLKDLQDLMSQIRILEASLGSGIKEMPQCELECYHKLGKSVVATTNIPLGCVIEPSQVTVKVATPQGIDGTALDSLIGKLSLVDIEKEDALQSWMVQPI
eukprot:TCALIF_03869-PA protein Name:"Similar to NANS Sialic acid synthase (Homo sapiens)" AED:0.19 eAED:0.19 QI:0/1/0/1/1/1/2/0/365